MPPVPCQTTLTSPCSHPTWRDKKSSCLKVGPTPKLMVIKLQLISSWVHTLAFSLPFSAPLTPISWECPLNKSLGQEPLSQGLLLGNPTEDTNSYLERIPCLFLCSNEPFCCDSAIQICGWVSMTWCSWPEEENGLASATGTWDHLRQTFPIGRAVALSPLNLIFYLTPPASLFN